MIRRGAAWLLLLLPLAPAGARAADASMRGQEVYDSVCKVCHGSGIAGSPRFGDRAAWAPRLQKGLALVYATALNGKGAMPPRGGRLDLADTDVRAAVDFMVRQAVGELPAGLVEAAPAPSSAAASAVGEAAPQAAALPRAGGAAARAGSGSRAAAAQPARATTASGGDAARLVGQRVYDSTCSVCHATGLAGAPRIGDGTAWRARALAGTAALYQSALGGKRAMPARGGNAQLADAEVRAAVDFMLQRSGVSPGASAAVAGAPARPPARAPSPRPAVATVAATAAAPAGAVGAGAVEAATGAADSTTGAADPAPTAAPLAAAPAAARGADPNAFNRLLRSPAGRHQPPASDGIHDPENDGTLLLQAPEQALAQLPKRNAAGDVDWVKAIGAANIAPRADLADPAAQMMVLDLNIVREVKGSMPDVVYPHAAHTRWLDCSNCHPAIFVPQKGANQISMAAILLGQKCGVCHGTVAFPVSECRRCHSSAKVSTPGAPP